MIQEALSNISELSKEELEMLKFRPYTINGGPSIMLIPKTFFPFIPKGTEVFSIYGDKLVLGKNYIDMNPVDGYILYGVVPKEEEEEKLTVPVGDVMQYCYFEAIPWYLNRIGSTSEKDRKSATHFHDLHSSYQGVDARAEYMKEHLIPGLAYLLLFSAISIIFHGNNRKAYESVVDFVGYSPVEGDWSFAEKFIEDELRVRMTPEDIKKVSLGTHRKKHSSTN